MTSMRRQRLQNTLGDSGRYITLWIIAHFVILLAHVFCSGSWFFLVTSFLWKTFSKGPWSFFLGYRLIALDWGLRGTERNALFIWNPEEHCKVNGREVFTSRAEPGWLGQLCASSLNKPVFIQIPKVWLCPWENGGCPEREANDFLPSQSDGGGGGTHRGSPTPLYWTVEGEWRSHRCLRVLQLYVAQSYMFCFKYSAGA